MRKKKHVFIGHWGKRHHLNMLRGAKCDLISRPSAEDP